MEVNTCFGIVSFWFVLVCFVLPKTCFWLREDELEDAENWKLLLTASLV